MPMRASLVVSTALVAVACLLSIAYVSRRRPSLTREDRRVRPDARELLPVHLEDRPTLSPKRENMLRFATEHHQGLKALSKVRAGECEESQIQVKIDSYEETFDDDAWYSYFCEENADIKVEATLENGEHRVTVDWFGKQNQIKSSKLCFDVKEGDDDPNKGLTIHITDVGFYWVRELGTYTFPYDVEGGWSQTSKDRSKGELGVTVVEPEIAVEEETPDPFFWTCPGVNAGRNFDRIRKDYNELTLAERELYIKAINTAKNRGYYDMFVAIHKYDTNDAFAHGTMAFFAWHRKFLIEFENMLRSLGDEFACVTIPFWDWAQEYKVCNAINEGKVKEVNQGDDDLVRGHGSLTECTSTFAIRSRDVAIAFSLSLSQQSFIQCTTRSN